MEQSIKPFVKWVGGKTQLLDIIETLIPKQYNRYFEPFLGGGAVFLRLKPKHALISDINSELITTWICIRDNKNKIIKDLNSKILNHSEDFYYKTRGQKNDDLVDYEKASRFIYLNKTCFNGLYRLNSKGENNVPYNKKDIVKESTFYSNENLNQIEKYLLNNKIEIQNKSYKDILQMAQKGDFIFVDPPYDYVTKIGFNSYDKDKWTKQDTEELLNTLIELDKKGVKWMLTNHNTPLINKMMAKYTSFLIPVNRFINSDADNRYLSTFETVTINYSIDKKQKDKFDLELFFKGLKSTSYFLKGYVSWNKISSKILANKNLIDNLNFLVSESLEQFWLNLKKLFEDPEKKLSLKLLPLLLAKRIEKGEAFIYIDNGELKTEQEFDYNSWNSVVEFLKLSGLIDNLFINKKVLDVKQYLYGLEVGLSNNDKKNKSGKFMEQSVMEILDKNKITFQKQIKYSEVVKEKLDQDKKFDFVFSLEGKTYCIEVNFFNGKGSKITSETDRFINLHEKINANKNMKFLWVTEGRGILSIKNKIEPIYNQNFIFNLTTFEKFIKLLKK